jgi:hypothetical protein
MKREVLAAASPVAGRRLSMWPPPAEGGRRPHKTPLRIQKLFAPNRYNTISHYKLSFWAAVSALWALAAAIPSSH